MWDEVNTIFDHFEFLHVSEPCDQYQDRHTLTSFVLLFTNGALLDKNGLFKETLCHVKICVFKKSEATVCVFLSDHT